LKQSHHVFAEGHGELSTEREGNSLEPLRNVVVFQILEGQSNDRRFAPLRVVPDLWGFLSMDIHKWEEAFLDVASISNRLRRLA
jgi:hypothetical protein